MLAAALLRLSRVARPETALIASVSAANSLVEVRSLSLRRPGSPATRALGWTLACAGRQLASGADPPPAQLVRVDAPQGVRVYACRAGARADLRGDTACVAVDPAHCRVVNPSR